MAQTSWPRFLLFYLLIGVIGTVLLAGICPVVNLSGFEPPPAVRAILQRIDACPSVQVAVRFIRNGFAWSYHAAQEPAPDERPAPAPPVAAAPQPEAARPTFTVKTRKPAEIPAAAESSAPSGLTSGPMWGVVTRPWAPVYDRSGKFLQKVKGGTLLDITETWSTKSGDMALCEAITGTYALTNTLIRLRDIDLRQGPLAQVSVREKELRGELGELLAQREDLQVQRRSQPALRPDNPHYAAYTAAKDAHRNFWDKVRALQAKRDAASGPRRMQLTDELALIRASRDDVKVGQALERAKADYERWNDANPPAADTPDRELAELNLKIMGLRGQIEGIQRLP